VEDAEHHGGALLDHGLDVEREEPAFEGRAAHDVQELAEAPRARTEVRGALQVAGEHVGVRQEPEDGERRPAEQESRPQRGTPVGREHVRDQRGHDHRGRGVVRHGEGGQEHGQLEASRSASGAPRHDTEQQRRQERCRQRVDLRERRLRPEHGAAGEAQRCRQRRGSRGSQAAREQVEQAHGRGRGDRRQQVDAPGEVAERQVGEEPPEQRVDRIARRVGRPEDLADELELRRVADSVEAGIQRPQVEQQRDREGQRREDGIGATREPAHRAGECTRLGRAVSAAARTRA
jgi:hypothetical protein